MKDGLLRSHPMVLNRPAAPVLHEPPTPTATNIHPCPVCPPSLPLGQRWGSFSFDGGRTWFCGRHKPEQRP